MNKNKKQGSPNSKKMDEEGVHDNLHFALITMEPTADAGPPSGAWANRLQSKPLYREPSKPVL